MEYIKSQKYCTPEHMSEIMGPNHVKLEEIWTDWLIRKNEYAVSDRRYMEAGAEKYINFTAIILRKNNFTYVFLFCRLPPRFIYMVGLFCEKSPLKCSCFAYQIYLFFTNFIIPY